MTSNEPLPPPPLRLRTALPVILGAAIVVIAAAVVLSRGSPSARPVNGVITHLDPVKRLGAAEVLDPRTNVQREILGEFPLDCLITINGRAAELSDVRVGDRVKVVATMWKEARPSGAQAQVKSVEVLR